VYFEGKDGSKAKISYAEAYADSIIYLMVDDRVYSYKLLDAQDAQDYLQPGGDGGQSDNKAIKLETDSTVTYRAGQQL
ncbi:MAG: hypothetical protein U9P38_04840, partial [Campylobacterota bacterium]|nr:hypothetical protein [Campylobacterota bacterium]